MDILDRLDTPRVFVSSSAETAAAYAVEYRAGGEAATGVRRIAEDIRRLAYDEAFFAQEAAHTDAAMLKTWSKTALDDLAAEVEALADEARRAAENHTHGVIYAVDLSGAAIDTTRGDHNACVPAIARDRIIAKTIIPIGCEPLLRGRAYNDMRNAAMMARMDWA